ncbi:glutaredoxin [Aspergillus homomorphus CBS 101889]|uniref:Putative glutaredoxin n=1 Tax=Aspergillus homomorphus (strain CBS 101889) TaxID=1450537 RepID=A0A395HQB1_ASPHC|nr:putative glutaredoxin [Aspergillus homomorphus CBS 101889]RAL09930.1 putative glutaredoxin [Aspergillus homomorphus CBS 101889]
MANAKTTAQNLINENGVVVFSKSYCPYCVASKRFLEKLGAEFKVLELDQTPDGQAIQDALQEITSQRTVPNIFIGQKHIGGNSDLQSQNPAQLKKMLTDAGAL